MKKLKIFSNIYIFIALFCSIVLFASCTKKYAEINTDKNKVASVGQAELPFLFSRAIESIPWSDQVAQNMFADQYAQYFADNAPYFLSDVLIIEMDWVRWNFDPMYTDVVPQLQTIFAGTD